MIFLFIPNICIIYPLPFFPLIYIFSYVILIISYSIKDSNKDARAVEKFSKLKNLTLKILTP